MTKIELAYLAGAMDSDGFFTIKRNTYSVRVLKNSKNPSYSERIGIKQTCPIIVDIIFNNYGGYRSTQKPNTPNGKLLYSIDVRNKKAVKFINDVLPYLKIKKQQAELLLQMRTLSYRDTVINGKAAVSNELINKKEGIITQIKQLNDSRTDIKHHPLAWR